ncbi:hypothetical protein AB0B94_30570 [Micromonospora sp. NPDC048986]|uniref:hypothetical protein n=1 Tax=Micromonospora sp. NPDC048986 TaxID=3155644 RepID=UPI0033C0ACF6
MTDHNTTANLATIDQNYALATELLAGPIEHATQLLAEDPTDTTRAWVSVTVGITDAPGASDADATAYVVDMLAAAVIRLAKATP